MKKLLLFLLLTAVCWPQTIASRRYAEKTFQQYTFGPFTPIAPYNNVAGYNTVADAQVQPSNVILDNNNFSSTSNFTILQQTDPSTTFTVTGNVGTVTTGTVSSATLLLGSTASSFTVPNSFEEVEVNTNGTALGTDIIALGMANAGGSVEIGAEMNVSSAYVHVHAAGADTTFGVVTSTRPTTTPWMLGFSLFNSWVGVWQNTGSGWKLITSADISSKYDPRTSGLSGFRSSLKTFTSQVSVWQFSNLKTSLFGGLGARDNALVVYPDGRPYMQGSLLYMLATIGGTSLNTQYWGSGNGIYSYDINSKALTLLGTIGVTRSSGVFEDQAGQIIYDPQNNQERLFIGSWGSTTGLGTYYTSQSISTDDWLSTSNHVHITPAATQMTLPNSSNPYDANAACTSWNYSTATCALWLLNYTTTGGGPRTATSTLDPSANTWTGLLNSISTGMEGGRTQRTATTYLGQGASWQSIFTYQLSGESRQNFAYNQAGTLQSPVVFNQLAGARNPSHMNMFSYGNNEYLLTFNDNLFGTATASLGNLAVASAPKYAAQTNWPIMVNEGDTFVAASSASATVSVGNYASTFTLTSGDLVVFMARGGTATVASATASDSLGDTFTCGTFNKLAPSGANGWEFACYSFVTHSGTATFTITPNVSSTFIGLTILQIHPGFLTTQDNAITFSNITTGSTTLFYTSGVFNTSARGLIIACPDLLAGGGVFIPGTIGPYQAAFGGGLTSGAAPCEGTLTDAAQTGITASLTSGSAVGWWGSAILSFK